MKLTCKHCGDKFQASKEDLQLLVDGQIDCITPVCDDCFEMSNNFVQEENYSDADNGL